MMNLLSELGAVFLSTLFDVLPIAVILFGFQYLVIRKPIPNLSRVLFGFGYVLVGLTFFLMGLEKALFPLGKIMARQLTDPAFLAEARQVADGVLTWQDYGWVYLFAFTIGFTTTIAEPSLIAVAMKASEVSGGAIRPWGLAHRGGPGGGRWDFAGSLSHRDRSADSLFHYFRLHRSRHSDCFCPPHDCTIGLRFGRGDHLDRHGAFGCRTGLGVGRNRART
jgi:hypothetical protein